MTATLERDQVLDKNFISKCRCAYGTVCTCWFYADWMIMRPSHYTEPVSVQLKRRRNASFRCDRLLCGHRDPISQSWW